MEDTPVTPEHMLAPLCQGWRGMIKRAVEAKSTFTDQAEECMAFLCDDHSFLWDWRSRFGFGKKSGDEADKKAPDFRMTTNKAHELVALFGPVLYSRNPVRTVTPRQTFLPPPELMIDQNLVMQVDQMGQAAMANPAIGQDPMFVQSYMSLQAALQQQQMAYQQQVMQQQMVGAQDKTRAGLIEKYLNYTPNELDLATNAQDAITEALVKGAGVLWTETREPAGSGRRLVGSFYDTIDNLQIDPDAETLEDAHWIARRCVHFYWEVEREYGLPRDSLKKYATMESGRTQGESEGDRNEKSRRARGETKDLLVYWKIYSKMGMGGRMSEMPEYLRDPLEAMGDYCYLVVAEGCPFLLNLPDEVINSEAERSANPDPTADPNEDPDAVLKQRVAWPIEFWRDERWPFTRIEFYRKPRYVWPISPLAPGLGELKFINWCMSYLANRVKTSCRDFIGIAKAAGEDIKNAILHGPDFTLVEIEALHGSIDNVVKFLSQPQVNGDIWTVLSAVMEMFDKRVGLTELVYGLSSRQMRSASEAKVKAEGISVRPDYMAQQVEKAMSECARRETFALRQLDGMEIEDIIPGAAQWWDALVRTDDLEHAAREFDVRVEAGSARRPNRERDVDNMNQVMTMLMPILDNHATMTSDTNPLNNAVTQWGQVIEKDVSGLLMGQRMPVMPPAPPQEEGGEEKQAA